MLAAQGDPTSAARLWGTAQALRASIGAPLPLVYRAAYAQAVSHARTRLGEEAFATTFAEGEAISLERILDVLSEILARLDEAITSTLFSPP